MGPQSGLSKTDVGKSFWTTTQLGPGFLPPPARAVAPKGPVSPFHRTQEPRVLDREIL